MKLLELVTHCEDHFIHFKNNDTVVSPRFRNKVFHCKIM